MQENDQNQYTFDGLGIVSGLLKRITGLGFVRPTPIQYKAIPIATSGEDVVGIAQTGSGKTLAFALPMIQMVNAKRKMGLILLPTRELAVQVEAAIKQVTGDFGFKTAIIIGGVNMKPQVRALRANPNIIVATPGRLIDHIEQKNISLSNVGMLVLDEADRMLDMGFAPQLKKILSFVPVNRQTMLFSATMPEEISGMARQYMKKPLRIEVARPGTTAEKIDQEVFLVERDQKLNLLGRLLGQYKGTVLIFSRTKHGAKKIARSIRDMGHTADEIHSNRSQSQRQSALKGFIAGKHRILVATDIAARGIDVSDIELVVNFDLPTQTEDYTHRIGRTGRAGKSGKAISFACSDEKGDIAQIQKLINMILPVKAPSGERLDAISNNERVVKKKGPSRSSRPQRRNRSGSERAKII